MKKNILIVILLVIVIVLGIYILNDYKNELISKSNLEEASTCDIPKSEIEESLDNSSYLGIYNYIEDGNTTSLVLNSDYSCIFYIGNDNEKAYFYGKYKIEDKKIILYSTFLQDSSSDEELYIDEEIHFNIVDSNVITSIYGRDKSIRLEKLYNII